MALRGIAADAAQQSGPNTRLRTVQLEALQSQLSDLREEIREYEALKSGDFSFEPLKSISELPKLLIRARIASGLSQLDLANRLQLKQQQIQRYEASDYASASFSRIKEVVAALGVELEDDLLAEKAEASLEDVLERVSNTGLEPAFVRKRLLPRRGWYPTPGQDCLSEDGFMVRTSAETIGRIFQWSPQQIIFGEELTLDAATKDVRFKVTSAANPQRVSAYTVYARYLALLTIQACSDSPIRPIPTDPRRIRVAIEADYGSLSLATIINYIWDLGVVVLPLDDPSAFHGACFRQGGRNVIVLKQKSSSCSRWAFDCLHELWHAGQDPDSSERNVLELDELSSKAHDTEEEKTASRFAGAVLLNGRGQELAEMCLFEAQNDLSRLKSAVQRVAAREGAPIDSLSNYLAYRLAAEQGENWWGTANSLQSIDMPWNVVRNMFFERADFTKLAEPDREVLAQALTTWEE